MDKPLIEIALISAEGDELRHPQPMAIGQENHRVIAEPLPADTPGGLAQAGDFGGGQILSGADVGVFMSLGKDELRHQDILPEEHSCFRCLEPEHTESVS